MQESFEATLTVLQWLTTTFIFAIGIGLLVIAGMYIRDVTQTKSAVRRYLSVVGRFGFLCEHLF